MAFTFPILKNKKFFFKLTGVEGDRLRVEFSRTLNREHLERVVGACCQVDEVIREFSHISHRFVVHHYAVIVGVLRSW